MMSAVIRPTVRVEMPSRRPACSSVLPRSNRSSSSRSRSLGASGRRTGGRCSAHWLDACQYCTNNAHITVSTAALLRMLAPAGARSESSGSTTRARSTMSIAVGRTGAVRTSAPSSTRRRRWGTVIALWRTLLTEIMRSRTPLLSRYPVSGSLTVSEAVVSSVALGANVSTSCCDSKASRSTARRAASGPTISSTIGADDGAGEASGAGRRASRSATTSASAARACSMSCCWRSTSARRRASMASRASAGAIGRSSSRRSAQGCGGERSRPCSTSSLRASSTSDAHRPRSPASGPAAAAGCASLARYTASATALIPNGSST